VSVISALDPNAVTLIEDAAAMAEAIVDADGPFEDSARDLLTALFLRELSTGELASVRSTAARHTEFLLEAQEVSDEDA
jgi:hypothetical protein